MVPDEPYYCAYCACKLCGKPITKRDSTCLTCSLCDKQCTQIYFIIDFKFIINYLDRTFENKLYVFMNTDHVKCSNESLTIDISRFPRAYCDKSCRKVHEKLESKIGVKRELESGLAWTLLHRFDKEYGSFEVDGSKRLESYSKLAVAFRILTACFEPIKDRHTRINMIRNVTYNCG